MKAAQIDFTQPQLDELTEFLDGHPFNVRFVTKAIKSYGLASFLADPRDFVEWKLRRAEDFLRLINLTSLECELVAAMSEYRFLPLELLKSITSDELPSIAQALRNLEDNCLAERRGDYFQVSAPLRDAIRRDKRFDRDERWRQKVASIIANTLSEYKNEDHVPVALLESGVLASIKGGKSPNFVASLILPSHLLSIARSFYDKRQLKDCIDFCKRAYELNTRLTLDAQVEVLRLWGLSLARKHEVADLESVVLAKLRQIDTRTARKNMLFLEGFSLRLRKDFEGAEGKLIESWKLGKENQSVNREIASLLCKQRRYSEAEGYARSAYRTAPTNPFIIDILAEILLGKAAHGLRIDQAELTKLIGELRIYGDAPGSSFFLIRQAQEYARDRKFPQALQAVSKAIDRTPTLLPPYFIRAEILLGLNDIAGVEKDLQEIERLLEQAGGFSEGDEIRLHELQAKVLLEKRQFRQAMTKIDTSAFLTKAMKKRLLTVLAKTIGAVGEGAADRQMVAWAKAYAK
ncbi:tetratricopeptide (TPR) repeat protein [Bradyrhizobium sp. S3.9.2]|uniref:tetratricopeptide repeat protein n=1 Tax=Bradyrhizobium sp. S3.9.2 TaxID=3156432 RepID=UPI0033916830